MVQIRKNLRSPRGASHFGYFLPEVTQLPPSQRETAMSKWLKYILSCVMVGALMGCSGISSQVAGGFDPKNLKKRKLVVFRKAPIVTVASDFPTTDLLTSSIREVFKENFEDQGVDRIAFEKRIDSIFFEEMQDMSSFGKFIVDTVSQKDSIELVQFQNGRNTLYGRIPHSIPNDSVLVLGLGRVVYTKVTDFNRPQSPLLAGKMDYIIYDPLIRQAIAGGQVSARSNSAFGLVIADSDWYSDIKKMASHLVDDLIELR